MRNFVTINREALKTAIKQKLLARIAEVKSGPFPHYNHDAEFSPSQWWVDAAMTDRRTLSTSANFEVDGDSLIITLNFSF